MEKFNKQFLGIDNINTSIFVKLKKHKNGCIKNTLFTRSRNEESLNLNYICSFQLIYQNICSETSQICCLINCNGTQLHNIQT